MPAMPPPPLPTTPCIPWTGRVNKDGYGTLGSRLAHRVAWEAERGPIPAGLVLDHLCSRRDCVRVDHLEAITQAENVARARRHHCRDRTTCPKGHPYDLISGGKRYCRTCRRAQARAADRARRARAKAAAA